MVKKVNAKQLFRSTSHVGNPRHIVINGAGHVKGRLASIIGKQLMQGMAVSVVRCEKIVLSGDTVKNMHRWERFLNLCGNTNPRIRSHQHRKAPSMMFWRTVRGTFKHKTNRGLSALLRLKCYDGVPKSLFKAPTMKAQEALAHTIYKPRRKTCTLGDLAVRVGWKHSEAVAQLDAERIAQAAAHNQEKMAITKKLNDANEKAKQSLTEEERKLIDLVGIY